MVSQAQFNMTQHTQIVLPIGSLELLLSAITTAGWTNKRREVIAAGCLADDLESHTIARPIFKGELSGGMPVYQLAFAKYRDEMRLWERLEVQLSLTDAQFQACVSCLRFFSDEKKVPANFYGAQLLLAFKLSE